jgi:Sulfotransferase family
MYRLAISGLMTPPCGISENGSDPSDSRHAPERHASDWLTAGGVVVSSVVFTPIPEEYGRLIGFSLDVLEFFTEGGISKLRVAGWIGARGPAVHAISFHSGYRTMRLEVAVPRDDVAAAFPGGSVPLNCGFHGALNVGGLGAMFALVVTAAQVADTRSGETIVWLGEICGRQQPLCGTPLESALAPISVTCLGRTGSTLAMRMLGAHPEIVVAGGYPYETKYAQKALCGLSDSLEAMLSDAAVCVSDAEPYRQFCDQTKRDLLGMTTSIIDRFYEYNARVQQKAEVRFFAEKCLPSFLPNVTQDVYGPRAREIIIVRDPRDLFCSAKSFNRKRGSTKFGAEYYETDTEWFSFLRYCFVQIAQCHERRTQALIIRYEDLLLDQRSTITKILRFLDVLDSDRVIEAIEASISQSESAFVDHMTSPTPRDSVARWPFFDNPDIFKTDSESYLNAMHTFGYL